MAIRFGPSALLVDDDLRLNESHRARLEADGYSVTLITDAAAALAWIEKTHPTVVVLGLMHARGRANVEFLEAMKVGVLGQHVPVVLLSAYLATPQRGRFRPVRREQW
ncbi:MAG TPA: hypothetical protein VND96_16705 [Candidatus Micrarchaeaceae archaeon]|nr:hypothetical protein [Candidatus Micrarchaeaceae archaeon]